MDSKAWAQYKADEGYVELGTTGTRCWLCDIGIVRIVERNGQRYEMCDTCHDSNAVTAAGEINDENMAKFKAILEQIEGEKT